MNILDILIWIAMVIWGFQMALSYEDGVTAKKLNDCQKQHNVYQCKMVAQPVEDER